MIHESVRRVSPAAPRMDILGENAIEKILEALGEPVPDEQTLHEWALAGDLASNTIYYSLAALGPADTAPVRGALLGTAAGLGAVFLPGPLGLGSAPSRRTFSTECMTVTWYLVGGLVAGLAHRILAKR